MELNSVNGIVSVMQSHDFPGMSWKIDPGGDFQVRSQRRFRDDQAVVARRGEGVGQAGEDSRSQVVNLRRFSVHQSFGPDDRRIVDFGEGLVAQADSQCRNGRSELPDQFHRNSRLVRRTRARRNDDSLRLQGGDLINADLIISRDVDVQSRVDLSKPLNEVVSKRIVIIENEEHRIQYRGKDQLKHGQRT